MTRSGSRVVVTGMAINTPLGDTLHAYGDGLLQGKSALSQWKTLNSEGIYSKVGGDLSLYDDKARRLRLREIIPEAHWKKLRKLSIKAPWSTRLSMLLGVDAFIHAGLFETPPKTETTGVLVAGHNINENYVFANRDQFDEEPDWMDPLLSLSRLDTDHGGCVSEVLGLRGPLYTVGAACASGNVALRLAFDEIRHRGQEVMVVVGAVLDYNPMELHAMALMGAISFQSFNDQPTKASRPFDKQREGFVPAHGGGCLVLESLEHAESRGANIHAELLAVDANSDANHLPTPSADGQTALMTKVLKQANLRPEQIDYINAHATSTPLGDVTEAKSIRRVFGSRDSLKVNAPKSMLGHTCWSAAIVESIGGILQMQRGELHPSINIDDMDPEIDMDVCQGEARKHPVQYFMKNSFGFGGINAVSIFGRAGQ